MITPENFEEELRESIIIMMAKVKAMCSEEYLDVVASLYFKVYTSLIKAGFTEDQAFEIVKNYKVA